MKRIFVDTSAVLALVNPADVQHDGARAAFDRLESSSAILVTTSFVLAECYALLTRRMGLEAVARFRAEFAPLLEVVWVDRELHEAGLDLLLRRERRDLSLVDTVSFLVIRNLKLDGAYACDHHFRSEGFSVLP